MTLWWLLSATGLFLRTNGCAYCVQSTHFAHRGFLCAGADKSLASKSMSRPEGDSPRLWAIPQFGAEQRVGAVGASRRSSTRVLGIQGQN